MVISVFFNTDDQTFIKTSYQFCSETDFSCTKDVCISFTGDQPFYETGDNPCSVTDFPCSDGTCIDHKRLCNGVRDCIHGEDEDYMTCEHHHVEKGIF